MISKKIYPVIAGVLVYLLAYPAIGSNLRWLDDSPVRYFTDEDWELLNAARNRALNEASDGETISWENPKSKSSGSITPISTSSNEGVRCRNLEISNSAKGAKGNSIFTFCRDPDGKWMAVKGKPRVQN